MRISPLTRNSGPVATLVLFVVIIVGHLRLLYGNSSACDVDFAWWEVVLSVVLQIVTGILVGRTAMATGVFRQFCTLPLPLYGIAASGIVLSPHLVASSAASLCVVAAVLFFVRSLADPSRKNSVFFFALCLSMATLLSPSCLIFVLFLPFAIVTSFTSLRKIVISLVGLLLPIAAASYIGWYRGADIESVVVGLWAQITTWRPLLFHGEVPYFAIIFGAIFLLLMLYDLVHRYIDRDVIVRVRRTQQSLFAIEVLGLAMLLLPGSDMGVVAVIAVPTAILVAAALDKLQPLLSTLIYWAIFLVWILRLILL